MKSVTLNGVSNRANGQCCFWTQLCFLSNFCHRAIFLVLNESPSHIAPLLLCKAHSLNSTQNSPDRETFLAVHLRTFSWVLCSRVPRRAGNLNILRSLIVGSKQSAKNNCFYLLWRCLSFVSRHPTATCGSTLVLRLVERPHTPSQVLGRHTYVNSKGQEV